jgi:uncharacterized protein (TIGR02271 family)
LAKERSDGFTELEERYSDYEVYDRNYEKIGKVDDLFVDENDQPEYLGVKMGFLGTSSTLIPIELVRINDRRKLVEVATDKETVKGGPTFTDDREITAEFERRVLSYYRVESTRASSAAERRAYGTYYSDVTDRDEQVDVQPGVTRGEVERERHVEQHRGEDELRVPRAEEELRAGTREREVGAVRVRKRVRTEREQIRVPKRREEVSVERVPVDREAPEAEIGEEVEVEVPVVEEEVVVEKRPVVKEEIRLRKDLVEEEEVVERDVRKEEVDIDAPREPRNG